MDKKEKMKQSIDLKPIEENFELRLNRFQNIQSGQYYFKNCKFSIWEYFQIKGWYELLINRSIEKSKQTFLFLQRYHFTSSSRIFENCMDKWNGNRNRK